MNNYRTLNVCMDERRVGTLAVTNNHLVAFEYDDEWLANGFAISPLSLPLQKEVFVPKGYDPFEGVFGVFSDSLPDGSGRLLVDRLLLKEKINPATVDSLNRLAIVGTSGMGALSYEPENRLDTSMSNLSLDQIALECKKMFETDQTETC